MAVRPPRRLFTIDEYDRMVDAAVLGEDERVEPIEGEIIEMAPRGSSHSGTVNRLTRLFTSRLGDRAVVAVQNPVRLPPRSEPQPDLVLLRPRDDFYSSSHPESADVLLVVEVAQSSLRFDRDTKVPLYARHGIEVDCELGSGGYGKCSVIRRGNAFGPAALPDVVVDVSDIIG